MKQLEEIVQKFTGKSPQELRERSISDLRRETELRFQKPMTFTNNFPFIGRGSVMRDRIVSHEQVERLLDDALKE